MLKNDDGSVRITSTDDIQVFNGTNERIKIGRIEDNIYGIRISNARGLPVMETDDSGELWLKNRMRVGTEETSTVEIGYLNAVHAVTGAHEVIHAGDSANQNDKPFIVYEDGRVVAKYIEALGGKIGNMSISEIESALDRYEILIISDKGNVI
jgi:hypothetical protein